MRSPKILALCVAFAVSALHTGLGQVYDNSSGYTGDIVDMGASGQNTMGDEIFLAGYESRTPTTVNRARLLVATEGLDLTGSFPITIEFSGPSLSGGDVLASSPFFDYGLFSSTVTLNNSGTPIGVSEVWFDLGTLTLPPRVLFEVSVSGLPAGVSVGLPSYGIPEAGDSFTDFTFNNTFRTLPNGPANFGLTLWTDDGAAPSFVVQPLSQSVPSLGSTVLSVSVSGQGVAYQWSKDGTPLAGRTAPSLQIVEFSESGDAGDYTVTATDAGGTVTSATAVVTLNPGNPPQIASPAGLSETRNVLVGATGVTLSVTDTPTGNTYAWSKISGANSGPLASTTASQELPTVDSDSAGIYQVVVSNNDGSQTATFTLNVFDGLTVTDRAPTETNFIGEGGTSAVIEFDIVGFVGSVNDLKIDWTGPAAVAGQGGGYDPDNVEGMVGLISSGAGAIARLTLDPVTLSENGTFTVTVNDGVSPEQTASRTLNVTLGAAQFTQTSGPGAVRLTYNSPDTISLRDAAGVVQTGTSIFFSYAITEVAGSVQNANLVTDPVLGSEPLERNPSITAQITAIDPLNEASAQFRILGFRELSGSNPLSPIFDETYTLGLVAELAPPVVTLPTTVNAVEGADVVLGEARTDPSGTTYQWKKDNVDIAGATSPTLPLTGIGAADEATYTLVVTLNEGGQQASASANTVLDIEFGIEIIANPSDLLGGLAQVTIDLDASDNVIAPTILRAQQSGATEFKWNKDGVDLKAFAPVPETAEVTLALSSVGTTAGAVQGAYKAIFRNSQSARETTVINLVPPATPPAITGITPRSTIVDFSPDVSGSEDITIAVNFTGSLPISAELQFLAESDSVFRTLETQPGLESNTVSFNRTIVNRADGGTYRVVLTNTAGFSQADVDVDIVASPVYFNVSNKGDTLHELPRFARILAGSGSSISLGVDGTYPITVKLFRTGDDGGTGADALLQTRTATSPETIVFQLPEVNGNEERVYRITAENAIGSARDLLPAFRYLTESTFNSRRTTSTGSRFVSPVELIDADASAVTFTAEPTISNPFIQYTVTRPGASFPEQLSGDSFQIDPAAGSIVGDYTITGTYPQEDLVQLSGFSPQTVNFRVETFSRKELPSVTEGDNVSFGIELSGSVPGVSFVWEKRGEALPAATGGLLEINNADALQDNGVYRVTATLNGREIATETFNFRIPTTPLAIFSDNIDGADVDPIRASFNDSSIEGFISNVGASIETGEPSADGFANSLWATWVAPSTGVLSVNYTQIDYLGRVDVFTDSIDQTGLTFTVNNGSKAELAVTEGTTYLIRIAGLNAAEIGDGYFSLSLLPSAVIGNIASTGNVTVLFKDPAISPRSATLVLPIANPTAGLSVEWTADPAGSVNITPLLNSGFDHQAELIVNSGFDRFNGTSVTITATVTEVVSGQTNVTTREIDLTLVGSIPPPLALMGDIITRPVRQSGTIALVTFAGDSGFLGAMAKIIRNSFSNLSRSVVTLQDGGQQRVAEESFYFNNNGNGKSIGEPNHGGVVGGHSFWYPFQAEISGQASISTNGSAFDTILAIYRPTSSQINFETLEEVAFDDNSGFDGEDSLVSFPVVAGEQYFVVVDGVNGAQGLGVLRLLIQAELDVEILADSATELTPGSQLSLRSSVGAGEGVTFQWSRNGVPISGATSDSYSVDAVGIADGGAYTVEVTESGVSAESDPLDVTIVGPEFLLQPEDLNLQSGETGVLETLAASASSISYQWLLNGAAVPGATSARLSVTEAGEYVVFATNASGTSTSEAVTVTFITPPSFVTSPTATLVEAPGEVVTLTVEAAGDIAGYQWQLDGEPVEGATSATYTIPSFSIADQGLYSVVVFGVGDFQLESRRVPVVFADAPFITLQPSTQIADAGEFVLFRVAFESATPATVVWKRDGEVVSIGEFALIFGVSSVTPADEGVYTAEITNDRGTTESRPAVLDVLAPPTILTAPLSQTVVVGDDVVFEAAVEGDGPITTQWLRDGIPIAGATGLTLSLPAVDAEASGAYSFRATNAFGTVTTAAADLGVIGTLFFATQPESRLVAVGSDVTFEAAVIEVGSVSYQWFLGGDPIEGATDPSLTLTSVTEEQSGAYNLVATNEAGSVASATAVLTAGEAPTIVTGPVAVVEREGFDASFSVVAEGLSPLSYQWLFNGSPIEGATASTLALSAIDVEDEGFYSVTVTNPLGSVTSVAAELALGSGIEIASISAVINSEGQTDITLTIIGLDGRRAFVQRAQRLGRWRNVGLLDENSDGIFEETISARTDERYYRVILLD